ncbi:MAG TPA: hypothetical protein VLF88_01460 [Candidatus Babeliales bacterium]|nr:hypothetical protein [Candidatus Babeliales bacterium]
MDVFGQIAEKIIAKQESIIGPVAIEQAKAVAGLKVHWDKKDVTVTGDQPKVIDNLVSRYKDLFGKISVEVSKEAAGSLISTLPAKEVPSLLR